MEKIITLDDHFPTGEPTLMVVGRWGNNSRFHLEKTASEDTYAFLKSVKPKPGFSIVLVNALGAYETYDDNKNGDGFPLLPYKEGVKATCGHPECEKSLNGWVSEPETLSHHYKTFEEHGGIYRHHQNKDKSKSLGRISHAFLNNRMKRVELLLEIDKSKDKELTDKIDAGEYLAVSMGCHVKWDVCTICGHRAPTRAYYCSHAKNNLRHIDSKTGKKVAVLNPSPRFFDISFVFRPADPTGYMLKKVAHVYELQPSAKLGEQIAYNKLKLADVKKVSDIKKTIEGDTMAIANDDKQLNVIKKYIQKDLVKPKKPLSTQQIQKLSSYPLSTIIQLKPTLLTTDIARLHTYKVAGIMPTLYELQKVSELTPIVYELAAKYASVEEMLGLMIKSADITDAVKDTFLRNFPLTAEGHKNMTPPNTDLLTLTDPYTGHMYKTTRGQALAQEKEDYKPRIIGSALMSAGAYGLLNKFINKAPTWLKLPVATLAGTTAFNNLYSPYRHNTYLTDQGIPVSGATEFVKMNEYVDKIAGDLQEHKRLVKKNTINKDAIIKTAEEKENASLTEIGLVELSPERAMGVLLSAL